MARLPRHYAGDLTAQPQRLALRVWLLLLLGSPAPAAGPPQVELIGTWHVLVHYTDDRSAHPDAMRWEDRIWVFELAGSRLRWTDYPIVIFGDRAGRFEALGTNRASRVMHAWEPNRGQLAQIESGLEVNPRGKKSKALRGADAQGWRSTSRPTRASASVITYTENWSITGMPALPVFERVDVLGSARSEAMDGVTRYTTTEVEPGGETLRGTFERDGTRHGAFRMMLAGSVSGVRGSGKSEGERVNELFFGEFGAALFAGEAELEEAIRGRAETGEEVPEEVRAAIRQQIRREIERSLRRKGMDPSDYRREIEALTKKVERQVLDEGRSLEEVGHMLEEGQITP